MVMAREKPFKQAVVLQSRLQKDDPTLQNGWNLYT